MAVITVERHIFYAEAVRYGSKSDTATPQVHLRVRSIRVPWGQGFNRLIGYLDTIQFGGAEFKVDLHSFEQLRSFLLGQGRSNPKIIVADVQKSDLYTKPEMAKYFADQYKQQLARETFPTHPVRPYLDENIWDRLPDSERAEYARSASGSKTLWRKNRPKHYEYKFEYPADNFGEIWLFVDPTYPTPRKVAHSTVVNIAKQVFDPKEIKTKLFQAREGSRKIFDMTGVIILGLGYRMRYWQGRAPAETPQWLESVQKRVREHLAKEMENRVFFPKTYNRLNPEKAWYAMGGYDVPSFSDITTPTPSGRIRKLRTFSSGKGFTPVPFKGAEKMLKPLFVVNARNQTEAVREANAYIYKLAHSSNAADQERSIDLARKFLASGWLVVPRNAVSYLQRGK